ncbi:hypothetical protein PsYK624_000190 [Phanerochaete sordida]|uniref:Uncharacterized protein n=1 Tax=Phanerochaete sordida TaxID=48140 RepID=A0A9P3FWL0_9APHY|nr:hypothetical protein PsYK624_000190 [Phanerochaete sordida]
MAQPQPVHPPIAVQGNLQQIQQAVQNVQQRANQLRAQYPRLAALAGITLVVGGGVVVIPAVEAALLLAAGFGPLGPIAGTLAPLLQSVFWGARTGGLFSLLQAAGMTIVAPSAVVTGLGSAVMGLGAWLGFRQGQPPNQVQLPNQGGEQPPHQGGGQPPNGGGGQPPNQGGGKPPHQGGGQPPN